MSFDVTFLFVFSRFYAVSTVLVRKVIFLILVFKNFFVTTDENGAYQATIDIGAIYVLLLSIIHFYSTSVNGNKFCRKKYL